MPIYQYRCEECKGMREAIQTLDADAPVCCGFPMTRRPTLPAMVKVKGQGFPSRRKWMDNWTPASPEFSTGSLHGEHY